MKRTIEIIEGIAYYLGKKLDFINSKLMDHFSFRDNGKYTITIKEGTRYLFDTEHGFDSHHRIFDTGSDTYDLFICKEYFDKLFFIPDENKKYNITIKEISSKK